MRTIGSHPGAIRYRLTIMILLILIVMIVFFDKLDDSQKEIEFASIVQTSNVITSSLAVVFATYAVKGKLKEQYLLAGANPFVFLSEYQVLPVAYKGVSDLARINELGSGWYYLSDTGSVIYKPIYFDEIFYFRIELIYDDLNHSGQFELQEDIQRRLTFVRKEKAD